SGPRTVTAVTPAPVTATAVLAAPTVAGAPAATAVVGNTLPANAGHYRVILLGVSVDALTKDTPDSADGIGDEIYAAAITMVWDRRSNLIQRRTSVRTLEYGDVDAIRKAATRIRAGSGGMHGGIVKGNVVPDGFVAGQMQGQPQ